VFVKTGKHRKAVDLADALRTRRGLITEGRDQLGLLRVWSVGNFLFELRGELMPAESF
jgi:hypothetical protein